MGDKSGRNTKSTVQEHFCSCSRDTDPAVTEFQMLLEDFQAVN